MQESTKSRTTRPTAEEIGKYLKYDPNTGLITWRVTMGSRAKAGCEAGAAVTFTHGKKYRQIGFRGAKILRARYRMAPKHRSLAFARD